MASDKLFFFLFQSNPDLILRWLEDLPADACGYSFSAPVLKEREYRLDVAVDLRRSSATFR